MSMIVLVQILMGMIFTFVAIFFFSLLCQNKCKKNIMYTFKVPIIFSFT